MLQRSNPEIMATATAEIGPVDTSFAALDPAQEEAAALLDGVREALRTAPEPRRARTWIGKVRSRWSPPAEPVEGLYLWGGVGRGKTYLMDWLAASQPPAGTRRLHFHHFMREIHEGLAGLPRQPDPLEVLAEGLCRDMRLLCLDEFVVTDITDAMILYGLLRALFARGLTLVTTSNTHPDELYLNGLQRQSFLPAIALLKRHCRVFELDGGTDYRRRTLEQAGVYFLTSDPETDAELEHYFGQLTAGHVETAASLEVNHREIPVVRLGKDVVWFDFDALCDTPRATADYIEIAREYHTVLLSGVPVLNAARASAARRFLHLIDEFYDRRVKLVLSAEVPLEGLYAGDLRDFPHERLQSRLTEMQSHEYLGARGR